MGNIKSSVAPSPGGYTTPQDLVQTYRRLGGVAWNYQFQIKGMYYNNGGPVDDFKSTTVLATKIPGKKLNTATVPYGAFEFNMPMNTAFPDNANWAVTFMSDAQGTVRDLYEMWQNSFYDFKNTQQGNGRLYDIELTYGTGTVKTAGAKDIYNIIKDLRIAQELKNKAQNGILTSADIGLICSKVDKKTEKQIRDTQEQSTDTTNIKHYTLYGCFPTLLNGIELNTAQANIVQFTVSLAYQWFDPNPRTQSIK